MKATKKQQALYPYTLQPIALGMSDDEFYRAQLALFDKGASAYDIKAVRTKEWVILGVIALSAIAGLIWLSGYSTVIFWLMLVGIGIYLLVRTLGLKWYAKREFEKQIGQNAIPEEMSKLKLGVQSHGLIMAIPANTTIMQSPQMRGMHMKTAPTQQGVIPWSAVSGWDETEDFLFVMFELQGQRGSQIIPKRLKDKGLPIHTITKHLSQVKARGLQLPTA